MMILSRIKVDYDNYIHFNHINVNISVLPVCTQYFTSIYKDIKTQFLQLCADDVVVPRI